MKYISTLFLARHLAALLLMWLRGQQFETPFVKGIFSAKSFYRSLGNLLLRHPWTYCYIMYIMHIYVMFKGAGLTVFPLGFCYGILNNLSFADSLIIHLVETSERKLNLRIQIKTFHPSHPEGNQNWYL